MARESKGMDRRYENREIDSKFEGIHQRLDGQDKVLADIARNQKEGFENVDRKVSYTNGKVKKIIVAIFLICGMFIGYLGQDALPTLIKLLI